MKILLILILFLFMISFVNATNYDLCYQETSNISTTCGGLSTGNYSFDANYFGINYSKPIFSNNAIWRVKHGNPAQYYNISIPSGCYNEPHLTLRFFSEYIEYTKKESHPECFNGTDWNIIGLNMSSPTGLSGGGTYGITNLYDGSFNTHNTYVDYFIAWVNNYDVNNATIYEEGIYWNITIPPLVPNQIDFSKFNYIRQYGKILSNHNACIDNTTLGHNITYEISIDLNKSIINVWAYEPCEFGCDIITNRCNDSSINQYLIVGLILLIIVVIIIIIIKVVT